MVSIVEPQIEYFGCPSTTLGTVSEVEPQMIQAFPRGDS